MNMSDFKKRVLDKFINEINKKTELLVFALSSRESNSRSLKKIHELSKVAPEPHLFADLSDVERKAIQDRINEYILNSKSQN